MKVKDFGSLEFEKYEGFRNKQSAKRSWFFRLDFLHENKARRCLFFFGYAGHQLGSLLNGRGVTIHISQERPEVEQFYYDRLDSNKDKTAPDLCDIGFNLESMQFVARTRNGCAVKVSSVEKVVQEFFSQIVDRQMKH